MNIRSLIISILFTTLVACSDPVVESGKLVDSARQYIAENHIHAAALELKNALKLQPDNAEARYLLGEMNMVVGDYAAAEKEYRRAREAGWDEAEAIIGTGEALVAGRDFKRVLKLVTSGDTFSGQQQADITALRGLAKLGQGDRVGAETLLSQAQKLDADAYHVAKLRANLLLDEGENQQAIEVIERAISTHGDQSDLQLLSAEGRLRDNDTEQAKQLFLKVIAKDSEKLVTAYGRIARIGLAQIYIRSNQLDKAQSTIAPLFKRFANDPLTNYIGGMLSLVKNDLDKAEERLLKVLKVAPEHANSQLLYGAVSFSQHNYEQAAYYISKYIDKVPDNSAARKLLGRTYILLGQDKDASDVLRDVSNTEDSELLAMVGFSSMRSGDLAAGIKGLEQAVAASPNDPGVRSELAKAYLTAGETERAINELNKLMQLEGESNRSDSLLIIAHLRKNENDKAIEVALSALSRDATSPKVLTLVGNVFVATGDKVEGRKYLVKALEQQADFVPAAMALAKLYEELDDSKNALKLYESVSNLGDLSVQPIMAMARIAEQAGDTETMLRMLQRARKQSPENTTPLVLLAQHYLAENDYENAAHLISEAEKRMPNNTVLLSLRARLLMSTRQHNEALAPLNQLVTRLPSSVYARAMLAETYWKLGQYDDAERQLALIIDKQAYYMPALILMANVQQAKGETAKAHESAATMIKVSPDLYKGYEIAADLYQSEARYSEAIQNYRLAQNLKPRAATAVKLAHVYGQIGDNRRVIDTLEDWVEREPDNNMLKRSLGNAYITSSQYKQAIAQFEAVVENNADDLVSLNNLAWLYTSRNPGKAKEYASKAYKQKPDDAGVMDTYGWIKVKTGDISEGKRLLEQAHRKLPGSAEVAYHYGAALIESGESLQGKRLIKQVLKQHPAFEGRADAEKLVR